MVCHWSTKLQSSSSIPVSPLEIDVWNFAWQCNGEKCRHRYRYIPQITCYKCNMVNLWHNYGVVWLWNQCFQVSVICDHTDCLQNKSVFYQWCQCTTEYLNYLVWVSVQLVSPRHSQLQSISSVGIPCSIVFASCLMRSPTQSKKTYVPFAHIMPGVHPKAPDWHIKSGAGHCAGTGPRWKGESNQPLQLCFLPIGRPSQ